MGRTELKEGTYYARTREQRRAYQKAYYEDKKHEISRARELEKTLNPERYAEKLARYKERYRQSREESCARRREAYIEAKKRANDTQ